MSAPSPPDPAQERLQQHLVLLREEPPRPGRDLLPAIVRRAGWQRAVREPLRSVGRLLAAALGGLMLVTGLRRRAGGR